MYLSTWRSEKSVGFYCFQNFMSLEYLDNGICYQSTYKKHFFSKRLSCHLPGTVQDRSAWRQDCGLINLLAWQLCRSQFSPRFQSDPAASSFILVGLEWLGALAIFCNAGKKHLQCVSVAVH